MKKDEFLAELRLKLSGLPQEDADNRVEFYGEMIADKMDEGKSEEEAIQEIGSVDEVVRQIASETPLFNLVKERTKPKKGIKGWQIALIASTFPIWLPLLIVALVLCIVSYLLIWIFVIVTYSLELSFVGGSIYGMISFFATMASGEPNYIGLAAWILLAGASILLFFGCIGATKVTLKLSKNIILGIKTAFIRKGSKK